MSKSGLFSLEYMQAIDLLIPFKVVVVQLQIHTANSFEFKHKMSQQKAQSHAEAHDLVHTSAVPVLGRLGTMHLDSREFNLNLKLGFEVLRTHLHDVYNIGWDVSKILLGENTS